MNGDKWIGTSGQEPGRKGAGGERRKGRKRDSQGCGKREKMKKIAIFCYILQNKWGNEEGTTTETGGIRERKVREAGGSEPLSPL